MGSGGMSAHDVLRVATNFGAEAIGFGNDLGSLEPGKLADILVLDADPLEDLRNTMGLQFIMKNGRLYDGNTIDEVWPRQRALPSYVWQNLDPNGVSAGIRGRVDSARLTHGEGGFRPTLSFFVLAQECRVTAWS
ncbi:MAG: hypothetical protein BMS9Abin29_0052 [Gemmatimonadota bacterium]|nr:MAG: hypothetical protein BMS9Abin29_0052 [Gemmatimonadota bacterium]